MRSKRQKKTGIHVTIRSSKSSAGIERNPSNFVVKQIPIRTNDHYAQSFSDVRVTSIKSKNSIERTQQNSSISNSSKILSSHIKERWANPMDYARKSNRNRNKKKKLTRQRCFILFLISFLIFITILIILLILLLKKPNDKIKTNRSAILRWNLTGITIAGITNQPGNDSTRLNYPFGLALDSFTTLYIADSFNHRVQKFVKGTSFGQTVAGQPNGVSGTTANTLKNPTDVALDWNNNIYIVDSNNNRIQLWKDGSSTGMTLAGTTFVGNGSNEFNYPYSFARDSYSGTLYITDYYNHRVMRYLSGASFGTVVAGGNGQGINNNQLNLPVGIYFDIISNSLFIANREAHNVLRWTLNTPNWTLISGNTNGIQGNTSSTFSRPMDVTLDPMGNVYVADSLNHRISFFPTKQINGTTIAGTSGISGINSTLLNRPYSVLLDNQLNLYVSDLNNHRVQKFIRY